MWQNKRNLFVESNLLRECVGRSRMKDITLFTIMQIAGVFPFSTQYTCNVVHKSQQLKRFDVQRQKIRKAKFENDLFEMEILFALVIRNC